MKTYSGVKISFSWIYPKNTISECEAWHIASKQPAENCKGISLNNYQNSTKRN